MLPECNQNSSSALQHDHIGPTAADAGDADSDGTGAQDKNTHSPPVMSCLKQLVRSRLGKNKNKSTTIDSSSFEALLYCLLSVKIYPPL